MLDSIKTYILIWIFFYRFLIVYDYYNPVLLKVLKRFGFFFFAQQKGIATTGINV